MHTPAVRRPAVAGRFYPGKPEVLTQQLDQYLAADSSAPEKTQTAMGCMVPHAGYIYSGKVAGAVFQRLPARATYIILCPNHTGRGAALAMMSQGEWQTPLGSVRIDTALAASLQHSCRLLEEDSKASTPSRLSYHSCSAAWEISPLSPSPSGSAVTPHWRRWGMAWPRR